MPTHSSLLHIAIGVLTFLGSTCIAGTSLADPVPGQRNSAAEAAAGFISSYCIDCHNAADKVADLDLESSPISEADWSDPATHRVWELALKRVESRQMPPPDYDRPDSADLLLGLESLTSVMDSVAKAKHEIPVVDSLRRMTRTEYQNSVRDLLGVQIDAAKWLPKDESSHGFDNITVGELSPAAISRYLALASHVSRVAVGTPTGFPTGLNVRLPADLTQEKHIAGLPLGTRGGLSVKHHFIETGNYKVAVRLTRDRDEMIEGLYRRHQIDVLLDRAVVHQFEVQPPKKGKDDTQIDANLNTLIPVKAGLHELAVTFPGSGDSLIEIKRQPFDAAYNRHRHPRQQPAIFEVSIVGPIEPEDAKGGSSDRDPDLILNQVVLDSKAKDEDTFSRRLIFATRPASDSIDDQMDAAESILRSLVRLAFRRDIQRDDLEIPLQFFRETISTESRSATVTATDRSWQHRFDYGIQRAIETVLVNPNFLFRVEEVEEESPADSAGTGTVQISDFELASRLSYFLWSSLPDAELLDLASAGRLSDPGVLASQVDRMLADERSGSLVSNFAAQWLQLRNIDSVTPDLRLFPDFDDNLRTAFRKETELLFDEAKRRNLSVLRLIDSDHTFLNERLAIHYGIHDVKGSHFRSVDLRDQDSPAKQHRGGILRHGSILSVTSYATRTSPTIRGNWVLENLFGTPPPPPPPNVPALKEPASALVELSVRDRLAKHRADPACASCHDLIDPVGFALDHFDAVGRWRLYDGDLAVDASGTLPDGRKVDGVQPLEQSLLDNPDLFVSTMVAKLMTFALGRGTDYRDSATIRNLVKKTKTDDYRFASLIHGIVQSEPFQYRSLP